MDRTPSSHQSGVKAAPLRLGTRASKLARRQTELVIAALARLDPSLDAQAVPLKSAGDRKRGPLATIGTVGVFTRDLEAALREGQVDALVHSLKDLPVVLPPDMALAALLPRSDSRDAALTRDGRRVVELPPGSTLGTSSPRRRAMARHAWPHLEAVEIRGNVDTRLKRLDEGVVDGLVMAAAGLLRLKVVRPIEILSIRTFMPAPGQGAIAVEVLKGSDAEGHLGRLDDAATRLATRAERVFLGAFGAGCSLPIGAHATIRGERMVLQGVVFDPAGRRRAGRIAGDPRAGDELARSLAQRLGA